MLSSGATRQIVLDTETTGLEIEHGHRIIEIGCVELINRRRTGNVFHRYIHPQRDIDREAIEVHGITADFLSDQPPFEEIVGEFIAFVAGAELVIHNAEFDVGFLDYELSLLRGDHGCIMDHCRVVDTLALARRLHPGQRNSLDALCRRYEVDSSARDLHGALLDARLLADVYLAMTGGQAMLLLSEDDGTASGRRSVQPQRIDRDGLHLEILHCSAAELEAHQRRLQGLEKASGGQCVWLQLDSGQQR